MLFKNRLILKSKIFLALQNKKKKEERLRKNPPPIPYKIELMLKSKGLWGPPKPIRERDDHLPIAVDNVYFLKDFAYRFNLNLSSKDLDFFHIFIPVLDATA